MNYLNLIRATVDHLEGVTLSVINFVSKMDIKKGIATKKIHMTISAPVDAVIQGNCNSY